VKRVAASENVGGRGGHREGSTFPDHLIVGVDDIGIVDNRVGLGVMIEVLNLSLKPLWVHEVVRVHYGDILPVRELRDLIAAVSLPVVTTIVSDEPDAWIMDGLNNG
jgi:hypothetical protein